MNEWPHLVLSEITEASCPFLAVQDAVVHEIRQILERSPAICTQVGCSSLDGHSPMAGTFTHEELSMSMTQKAITRYFVGCIEYWTTLWARASAWLASHPCNRESRLVLVGRDKHCRMSSNSEFEQRQWTALCPLVG